MKRFRHWQWTLRIYVLRFSWGVGWLYDLNLSDAQLRNLEAAGIKPLSLTQVINTTMISFVVMALLIAWLRWLIGMPLVKSELLMLVFATGWWPFAVGLCWLGRRLRGGE